MTHKFPCPLCAGPLEVAAESLGQFAPCPHCGEEIPLEKPSAASDFVVKGSGMGQYYHARNRSAGHETEPLSKDMQSSIVISIVLSVLIPLAGFFCGIYLITKKQPGYGCFCMALSIAWFIVGLQFL